MRICLVRCPSPFLIDERCLPPLGLLAVGAGLRSQGHAVTVHDGDLEQIPLDYPFYGFGPTAPEYPAALETMRLIRGANMTAKIIIGGPHATINHELIRRDGWDAIVVGDGEFAAQDGFISGERLIKAPELLLDVYPHPDRSLVDIHSYHYQLDGRPGTTLVTSRGCPFHCAFCCKNHNRVRLRTAPSVADEIRMLDDDYGFKALVFPEDIFILHQQRTQDICNILRDRGIIWRCLVRADLVVRYGYKFLKMMAKSGCTCVGMGIESGSETILTNINKGETAATMLKAIKMLHSAGIRVRGYLIVGLPGETRQTLEETEEFLKTAKMDDIDCKIYQPFPGSPIVDHPESYDVHWNEGPLESSFYKGRPGDYRGSISTSSLSTDQIIEAWKHIEETYKPKSHA